MIFKKILNKMQRNSKTFSGKPRINTNTIQEYTYPDYESTIKTLNTLQSNAKYIKQAQNERLSHPEQYSKTILQTQKYLIRSGVGLETLDKLPVIHVAGTKGKGSTCALCESILRHHGLRTGFYSSPHLVEVRERIRVNGSPIKKSSFVEHFWNIFNKLEKEKDYPNDMPFYFSFLTILAFRIFLMEKVDVAIIEVGIGGEYDSTNILRNVPVVGITSLGLDHTTMLGNTLEQIAWHKGGIMKSNSRVFSVPQSGAALKVLQDRSIERNSILNIIDPHLNSSLMNGYHIPVDVHKLNTSLALALSKAWLDFKGINTDIANSELTKLALSNYKWLGRFQIICSSKNMYYLDGAHTVESIQICTNWYREETKTSLHKKILIFNATGDRNSKDLLDKLKVCNFHKIYFVPNKATANDHEDNKHFNIIDNEQMARCYKHYKLWNSLNLGNNNFEKSELVKVLPSISHVLEECQNDKYDILITGSLHLVGTALSIIKSNI